MQTKSMLELLREKDLKNFAMSYNGLRYFENQSDRKLEIAYNRFSSINVS